MIIEIDTLRFEAIIGLLPFERNMPQTVEVDITIEYRYPCSSCRSGYIDYAKIVEVVKNHIMEGRYQLLEDAIVGVKNSIIALYPQITSMTISISKPNILPDCMVRVKESFKIG